MQGQGEPSIASRSPGLTPRRWALVGLALTALALADPAFAREAEDTPSGFPVPRYLSLKFDKVNARAGPGDDHQVLWVYRVRGLPVQIVAETREWRRICDPEGGLAWVHRRVIDGNRTVMSLGTAPVALRRRPRPEAEITAYVNPRSIAALDKCDKGWCRLSLEGVRGWTPQNEVWGAAAPIQCR
ncbi:SH3 domain-containing protein [Phenylobacterium sp.]|uniref:SH3 domain-containing protein n=1 Tax=Phenylobacterium sp. TaxID=1871053 RepID=UPI00273019AF|nr:SH3 domain-containing protein [Phenylobacterium sp.]MDP1872893.1 SH3 domain-containing protein [Phenylobacterium sp.]